MILEIEHLNKSLGQIQAVRDLSFHVKEVAADCFLAGGILCDRVLLCQYADGAG